MSSAIAGSLVDLLQLSTLPPKSNSRQKKKLQAPHMWTDEERNLVSYLRLHRDWSWAQIQRTFFPSITPAAIRLLYKRLSARERAYRASTASSHVINPVDLANVRDNNLPVWRTSIQLVRPGQIERNVGSTSSEASSGELFGLEVRVASASARDPSTPTSLSEDFFSAEEGPLAP
jgi:hypothetical protein